MNTLELFNHVDIEYFEKPGAGWCASTTPT